MFDSMKIQEIEATPIPADLDTMPPGPVLAGFLASIDVNGVSGFDRVVVLRAHQRMASHYSAGVYRDMAAVVDSMSEFEDQPAMAAESGAAEIRAALHLTRRAADTELAFALDLRDRFPRLADMLEAGGDRCAAGEDDRTLHGASHRRGGP